MPDTFLRTGNTVVRKTDKALPLWNVQSCVGQRCKSILKAQSTTGRFQQIRPKTLQLLNSKIFGISALVPQTIAVILFDFSFSLTVLIQKHPEMLLFKPCPRTV